MREILAAESRAVENIPYTADFDRAVNLIVEHVHHSGGKLVTSGMGKAGQIAMNIATTFSSTGVPAVNLHPSEAQHGDLGVLQPNDVMLLISNSGKTTEIIDLVGLARRMQPDIPIITITGHPVGRAGRRHPVHRRRTRGVPAGSDPDHLHNPDDSNRRHPGCKRDETHRIHPPRLCPAPSWGLPGPCSPLSANRRPIITDNGS